MLSAKHCLDFSAAGPPMTTHDPYAPPLSDLTPSGSPATDDDDDGAQLEAERIRRAHLTHEARLKSVGSLMLLTAFYLLVGPPTIFSGLYMLVLAPTQHDEVLTAIFVALMVGLVGVILTALGALGYRAGTGLRRLDPRYRLAYTALACVWLMSCSVASLIGLWALYLIHGPAGQRVLSPEYAEIRRLTPHLQSTHSVVTWAVALLLCVGLVLAVYIAAL